MVGSPDSDHEGIVLEKAEDTVRWREIFVRDHVGTVAIVCSGVWLHAADSLLVSTMLPAIIAEIGGTRLMPWTFALYEIGTIVVGAASGLLAMRFGISRAMSLAALCFAIGCAVSAVAPDMPTLLAGRLLQGLGGGGLMALAFVASGLLFPKRLIARIMGAVSTIWAVSAFTGPLIGGLFVEYGSWRGGFWFFCLQAIALCAWLAARKEPMALDEAPEKVGGFPLVRLGWLSAAVVAIAYAGIDIDGVTTPLFVVAGLVCLAAFLRLEKGRGRDRLLPRSPFAPTNRLGAALLMVLFYSAATIAIGVYVPFLLTSLHGLSALAAGYLIAGEAIAWTVAALLISGQPEKRDGMLIVSGMAIVMVSIAGFAFCIAGGPLWLIVLSALGQGFGFGIAWTFILRRATVIAPTDETHRVAGAIPTVQRLGYALGAAFIGIVANASGIDGSLDAVRGAAVAIFLASLLPAAIGFMATLRFVAGGGVEAETQR